MCEGMMIPPGGHYGGAVTIILSAHRRTTGIHGRARRGRPLSKLHLLMSVTITTEIPGVGGVSRPGENKTIRNSRMQYDTNFKSRLSTLYTECQRPLLEAAMPDAGSFLGVLLECSLQNV